jgi:hypothetical protein
LIVALKALLRVQNDFANVVVDLVALVVDALIVRSVFIAFFQSGLLLEKLLAFSVCLHVRSCSE